MKAITLLIAWTWIIVPLGWESYGVGWARERTDDETPMILESYLHTLNNDARKTLLERLQTP